jgi:DNA-directed RNA polymerase subunit RPC12/RpoP
MRGATTAIVRPMVEAVLLDCANCGGPLKAPETGNEVTCGYCGRRLMVQGQSTAQTQPSAPGLTEELLRGYNQTVGDGRRYTPAQMLTRDWQCYEYGLWPASARASSTFGLGWSANALLGAPKVYPRCGDRSGAWAPGTRRSRTEWVEVDFPAGPPARAIRVFETCMPGATFALTVRDGAQEERIWEGSPALTGQEAMVLEVPLDPPRHIRTVRAYVSNELGTGWSEVDTIGLVATQPVPQALRKRPGRGSRSVLTMVLGAAVIAGIIGWVLSSGGEDSSEETGSEETGSRPAVRKSASRVPRPAETVAGVKMMTWSATVAAMNAEPTFWATGVSAFSSQYGSDAWAASRATGSPDFYPSHGDSSKAWAPRGSNSGEEWLTVHFSKPIVARSVIIVETFHPGSLARIDDVSGPKAAVLWEGSTGKIDEARVLSLELSKPRKLSKIRIVLDTTRRAGWSAIDAVGLVPQRKGGKAGKGKPANKGRR